MPVREVDVLAHVGDPLDCSDAEVAELLAVSPIEHTAVWLSTAAMTGVKIGPLTTTVLLKRFEDRCWLSSTWGADLLAVVGDSSSLVSVVRSLPVTSDVCYDVIRHPLVCIETLSSLPAHEIANLAALGFYRSDVSCDEAASMRRFASDLDESHVEGVADILLAGGLRYDRCWEKSHLPWEFATACDITAALINKWGRHLVLLSAYAATRTGVGPLAPVPGENLVTHCATLALRLGDTRETVSALACELSSEMSVERAVAAAVALCG